MSDGKSCLQRPYIFAVPGDISGSYVADKNGRIRINNLASGEYHVIETKALDGYILDTDVHSITVYGNRRQTSHFKINKYSKGGYSYSKS